jgi:hypothetical protein
MTWFLWLGLVLCLLVLAFVGLRAYGTKRWAKSVQVLARRLAAARLDTRTPPAYQTRYHLRELDGLPAPVQRYLRAVLKDGQPIICSATVDMEGTFNLSATGGEQWRPFTATQRVVTSRPGLVWDAQIAMLPGAPVRVADSYIAGLGLLHAAGLGLFTVADIRGGGEIARGEFMRFFAVAAWYPTALLPSQGVQWQAVDDRSANATLADGPLTLTLLFRFNDAGLIDSFRAEARGAMVGNDMVMLPWEGRWSNYQTHGGLTVPFTGEVAWVRPEGRKPYFKGTVTALHHGFSV